MELPERSCKNALNNLIGITGITNNISIISLSKDTNKKET
jgi:hypothetical protein